MVSTYAYLCNTRLCNNCSFPTCSHTTNKQYRLYKEGDERVEMRLVGSANGINYYMEYVKKSF
jgi:hypothetical protein